MMSVPEDKPTKLETLEVVAELANRVKKVIGISNAALN